MKSFLKIDWVVILTTSPRKCPKCMDLSHIITEPRKNAQMKALCLTIKHPNNLKLIILWTEAQSRPKISAIIPVIRRLWETYKLTQDWVANDNIRIRSPFGSQAKQAMTRICNPILVIL